MNDNADRFQRTRLLLGHKAVEDLQKAKVAIIGLGAVGGFCLEALVRSGISQFILCDMDYISISNYNRQILAHDNSYHLSKVSQASKRCKEINGKVQLSLHETMLDQYNVSEIISADCDAIVDAIDSLNLKIAFLQHCLQNDLPIISAMGMARRIDAQQVSLGSITEVSGDPLAKKLRKGLRRRGMGEYLDTLPVVYSKEPALATIEDCEQGDTQLITRGRDRQVLGSICHVPAVAGLLIAQWVINHIIHQEILS